MSNPSTLQPLITKIKNFTRFFGIDLVRYNMYHSEDVLLKHILNHFQIKTILDVGANIGQYAVQVLRHGYGGEIHSFEPIPSVFQKLLKKSQKFPNWKAYNLGVGSKVEEVMINISENFVSSSILRVGNASLSAEPKTRITHQEKIKITTIDSFFQGKTLEKEILLKLDVQGYEQEALKGAIKNLPSIRLIQAELSFTEIYEGGPLFGQVVDFLTDQGFEIFTIIPGFRDERSGRLLQADGIFVKKK